MPRTVSFQNMSTLWIVPLTLGLVFAAGHSHRMKQAGETAAGVGSHAMARNPKVEIPWFIAFFLLASPP